MVKQTNKYIYITHWENAFNDDDDDDDGNTITSTMAFMMLVTKLNIFVVV